MTSGTVSCDTQTASNRKSRSGTGVGDVVANLTEIADSLKALSITASSGAAQGLVEVGCAAESAFQQLLAYYFNKAQVQLDIITQDILLIQEFIRTLFGLTTTITTPVSFWIDQTDTSFQELVCYINTPDGRQSRIWRTLMKHSDFHAGLNVVLSIQNVANQNLIIQIIDLALEMFAVNIVEGYISYIGSAGSLVLGVRKHGLFKWSLAPPNLTLFPFILVIFLTLILLYNAQNIHMDCITSWIYPFTPFTPFLQATWLTLTLLPSGLKLIEYAPRNGSMTTLKNQRRRNPMKMTKMNGFPDTKSTPS